MAEHGFLGSMTAAGLNFRITEIRLEKGAFVIAGMRRGPVPESAGPVEIRGPDGILVTSARGNARIPSAEESQVVTFTARLKVQATWTDPDD